MANEVDDMSADPDRGILDPERARSAAPAGAVPHGSAMASGTQPIGSAPVRTAVLRQGLPRTSAYRASTVRRSPHPTPVATPIVTVTLVPTAPAATPSIEPPPVDHPREPIAAIAPPPSPLESAADPMVGGAGREVEPADPRASDDAVLDAPDASAPLATADTASSTPAIAAVPSAPTAGATRVRPPDVAARPIGRRMRRIGLGVLGAAVLGGVLLLSALGSPRNDARVGSRSAFPAAADLVHAVSNPAPPAIEVVPPRAVALTRAASVAPAPPVAPSPATTSGAPVAAPIARAAATRDPSPRQPSAPEPTRARPATPPKPGPARPLTYDPDALFLPKQ